MSRAAPTPTVIPSATLAAAPLTLSLPEQIASQLAARITSAVYSPGQRILEQAVAGEFAVSRGPVREALRLLEKDGLVRILPRRGAQVTNLSIAEVREIFDIRAALNGLRDREIAEDAQRLQLLPLIEVEVKKLATQARDPALGDAYAETVFGLNRLLNSASRSVRLRSILGALAQQTLRYSKLSLSTAERRRQSVKHWQELVRAIRSGDGESAQRTAERRVRDSRDAAIKNWKRPAKPEGRPYDQPSRMATTWPSATGSFGCTRISFTTPPSSVITGISIFIDSTIINTSPSSTLSPTAEVCFHKVPVISDLTSILAMIASPAGYEVRAV